MFLLLPLIWKWTKQSTACCYYSSFGQCRQMTVFDAHWQMSEEGEMLFSSGLRKQSIRSFPSVFPGLQRVWDCLGFSSFRVWWETTRWRGSRWKMNEMRRLKVSVDLISNDQRETRLATPLLSFVVHTVSLSFLLLPLTEATGWLKEPTITTRVQGVSCKCQVREKGEWIFRFSFEKFPYTLSTERYKWVLTGNEKSWHDEIIWSRWWYFTVVVSDEEAYVDDDVYE